MLATGDLCKVLIVDDEILIRQGIKHYLNWEQEGFLIAGEASNGREALDMIETAKPDIILMDIVMPIMDGEELTRVVKERYPDIEIIVLSSFGEFDYVRSAFQSGVVDYILKPKLDGEGLLKALRTAVARIPSLQPAGIQQNGSMSIGHIIEKLMSGYVADYNQSSVMQYFPYSDYLLLAADVKNHSSKIDQAAFIKKVENACLDTVGEAASCTVSYEHDPLVFVFNTTSENLSILKSAAGRMAESMRDTAFAMSREFSEFSQIGTICKTELIPLLSCRFYLPDTALIVKDTLPGLPADGAGEFNLDWFNGEFKRKNFEEAFTYLDDHIQVLSKCYTTDVFEFKSVLGNMIFNITILLGNMDYDVKELQNHKYTYFKSIEGAASAGEAVSHLNKFLDDVKKCLFTSEEQPNLNMKRLMDYLKEHYREPLTLTDVARHFHFNPSYLSSYFSSHNKESFVEYINRLRIEEASRLLLQDAAAISEISSMVGYSDHSYFCKVFKKITGLSPSQYKRKHYT